MTRTEPPAADEFRRAVSLVAPWALMGLLAAALIFVAREGLALAILAVVAATFVLYVVFFGLERSGRYLVVLAFFCAPWSALVLPMATFVTVADLFFAMGFGLLLPSLVLGREVLKLPLLWVVGVLVSLVMGTLACLLADHTLASFGMYARYLAGVIILPMVFMFWRPPVRVIGHLAMAYALGVVASIGYGVTKGGERPGARFIGMTEHPNVLGITGMIGLALIPFIWTRVRREWQWFWVLVAGVNAAAVWFSGSRAALVVTVVVVVMWPVVERSFRGGLWLALAGAVGILVADYFLSASGDSAIARLLGGGSASFSDAERADLLEHYWNEFLERPLIGHGFEEAVLGHNVFLQMAHAMGIIGALGFVLILLCGCLFLLTLPRPLHRIAYPVIAYLGLAGLTSVIWDRFIWAPLALAFAMAVTAHRGGSRASELSASSEDPGARRARTRQTQPVR